MKRKFDCELHLGYDTENEAMSINPVINGKLVTEPHKLPAEDFERLLRMCVTLTNSIYAQAALRHDKIGKMMNEFDAQANNAASLYFSKLDEA